MELVEGYLIHGRNFTKLLDESPTLKAKGRTAAQICRKFQHLVDTNHPALEGIDPSLLQVHHQSKRIWTKELTLELVKGHHSYARKSGYTSKGNGYYAEIIANSPKLKAARLTVHQLRTKIGELRRKNSPLLAPKQSRNTLDNYFSK